MTNYIVIDIETTGLDTTKDVPIQLAYEVISLDSGYYVYRSKGSFYVKIHGKLDKKITEITGIEDSTLQEEGVIPRDAAANYHSLIWTHWPAWLVGYNIVNFDFPIIQNWLSKYTPGRFKHPPLLGIVDVMFVCYGEFGQRKWPKLVDAGQRLKIDFDPKELHDARADVSLTWKILAKIKGWEEEDG